jgi:hypothetical protein
MWSIIDQYCKIVINEKAGVESTKEIGGCLCMLSRHRKEVLMMPNPIGYFPGISRTDYDLESLGNAIQLHEGDKKTCNGALKTEHVIPSFFGLPKSSDDIIIVLVLAVCKGWMTISQSLKITKNKHFLPLYKSVSKQ